MHVKASGRIHTKSLYQLPPRNGLRQILCFPKYLFLYIRKCYPKHVFYNLKKMMIYFHTIPDRVISQEEDSGESRIKDRKTEGNEASRKGGWLHNTFRAFHSRILRFPCQGFTINMLLLCFSSRLTGSISLSTQFIFPMVPSFCFTHYNLSDSSLSHSLQLDSSSCLVFMYALSINASHLSFFLFFFLFLFSSTSLSYFVLSFFFYSPFPSFSL